MKITMQSMRKRLRYLPENQSQVSGKAIESFTRRIEKAIQNESVNELVTCIRQSCGDFAQYVQVESVIDMLETLSECASPSMFETSCNLVLKEYVDKTRDAKDSQTNLKRKLGRISSKVTTKVNNNIEDSKEAIAALVSGAKSNFKSNTNQMKANVAKGLKKPDPAKEKATAKNESTLLFTLMEMDSMYSDIIQRDRILENYNKISKRFNVDKVLQEECRRFGVETATIRICSMVETYNFADSIKYNTVLETCWYGMNKNRIEFNISEMVTTATDYFIAKGGNVANCKRILENSVVVGEDDYKGDLEVITEEEPEDDVVTEASKKGKEGDTPIPTSHIDKMKLAIDKFGDDGTNVMRKLGVCLLSYPAFASDLTGIPQGIVLDGDEEFTKKLPESFLTAYEKNPSIVNHFKFNIIPMRKRSFEYELKVMKDIEAGKKLSASSGEFLLDYTYTHANMNAAIKRGLTRQDIERTIKFDKSTYFPLIEKKYAEYMRTNGKQSVGEQVREFCTDYSGFPYVPIRESNDFEKLFNDFKAKEEDDDKKVNKLQMTVRKLYSRSVDNVVEGTPSLLKYIRVVFIIGGFAITPVLGAVMLIADIFTSIDHERDEIRKMKACFDKERKEVEKQVEAAKTDEEKERLLQYQEALEKAYVKIDEAHDEMLTDKERDALYANNEDNDEEDSSDGNSDDDFDFDDASFDDEFGDDMEGLDEAVKLVSKMATIFEAHNNCDLQSIDKDTCKRIITMAPYVIEELAATSKAFPDILNKNTLYSALNEINSDIRSGSLKINYVDRFNISTVLSECSNYPYQAPEANPGVDIFSEYSYMVSRTNTLIGLNEMVSNCVYYSSLTEASFLNSIKLASEKVKKSLQNLSDKDKTVTKNIDVAADSTRKAIEKSLSTDNREAVIKGQIVPSASKVIKGTILAAGTGVLLGPVYAIIGVLGWLGMSKKYQAKERQLVLDEIETELKVCEKYIAIAESKDDVKALRNLWGIQKALERQRSRIRYNMKTKFNQVSLDTDKTLTTLK